MKKGLNGENKGGGGSSGGSVVLSNVKGCTHRVTEVDIDASKGLVDLCVHFFVTLEDIQRNGYRQKKFLLLFRLNSNMLDISLALSSFSYQN